jgi:hypothetical protein
MLIKKKEEKIRELIVKRVSDLMEYDKMIIKIPLGNPLYGKLSINLNVCVDFKSRRILWEHKDAIIIVFTNGTKKSINFIPIPKENCPEKEQKIKLFQHLRQNEKIKFLENEQFKILYENSFRVDPQKSERSDESYFSFNIVELTNYHVGLDNNFALRNCPLKTMNYSYSNILFQCWLQKFKEEMEKFKENKMHLKKLKAMSSKLGSNIIFEKNETKESKWEKLEIFLKETLKAFVRNTFLFF